MTNRGLGRSAQCQTKGKPAPRSSWSPTYYGLQALRHTRKMILDTAFIDYRGLYTILGEKKQLIHLPSLREQALVFTFMCDSYHMQRKI